MEENDSVQQFITSFVRPFSLAEKSYLRAGLLRLSEERHLLMIDVHHSMSDGISMGIMIGDLLQLYDGKTLSKPTVQYKDFAVWERVQSEGENYEESGRYWREQFKERPPVLHLPYDHPHRKRKQRQSDACERSLGPELTRKLQKLALGRNVSLYTVLLSAYAILLTKYSGEEDIVIGAPVAGRTHRDLEGIVGMFVKTLPLRLFAQASLPLESFIRHVHERMLDAFEHQNYPLDALLEQLELPRDSGRHPLFDTLFVLQNMELSDFESDALLIRRVPVAGQAPKFDLTWGAYEQEDNLTVTVEYDTALFREETVERMLRHYERILEQIAEQSERLIAEVELLTAAEKARLEAFAGTVVEYPRNLTIYERFLQQVERMPDETALVFGDERVSYRELERRTRLLSQELCRRGVQRGDAVGLLADRSLGMIVSIFAILRAGAAYVPLDPTHPQERLSYMLKDSGARLLLADAGLKRPEFAGEVVMIDERLWCRGSEQDVRETETARIDPTDTAYMMYTSGSTDYLKGVVTTHRNVIKTSVNNGFIDIGPGDRMLQLSNYAFDGSTYEIFGALLNGATLVLIRREDVLNAAALCRVFKEERITSAFMTAALFNTVV